MDLLYFLGTHRVLDEIGPVVETAGNERDYAFVVTERGTCIMVRDELKFTFGSNLLNPLTLSV